MISAILLLRLRPQDFLLTAVSLLFVASAVMVFSASAFHWSVEGDAYFFLRRQCLWLLLAGLVGTLFYQIDYRIFRRYHVHILVLTIGLLVLVVVPHIGHMVNKSRR